MKKADLHVHIDGLEYNEEEVIKLLKQAETNNVKALGLLSRTGVNGYLPGGAIYELAKKNAIKDYYTGKIVTAVEIPCVIDEYPEYAPFCGYESHILLYGFDPNKYFDEFVYADPKKAKLFWEKDIDKLIEIGKKLNLDIPNKEYFRLHYKQGQNVGDSVKLLHKAMLENPNLKNQFSQIFNGNIPHNTSDFARHLLDRDKGVFYFKRAGYSSFNEVMELAQKLDCKAVIAHPYYMNKNFNGKDYLTFLLKVGKGKINGVESNYYLDNLQERIQIEAISRHFGVNFFTAGSDYQPIYKAPYMFNSRGERFYQMPGKHPDDLPLEMTEKDINSLPSFNDDYQKVKQVERTL